MVSVGFCRLFFCVVVLCGVGVFVCGVGAFFVGDLEYINLSQDLFCVTIYIYIYIDIADYS